MNYFNRVIGDTFHLLTILIELLVRTSNTFPQLTILIQFLLKIGNAL